MIILGIEASCDETAAAIIEGGKRGIKVLSNVVSSQIEIHKKYGGVVPEVAAREHVLNILPVVNEALEKAGIKREEAAEKIDAIAVTVGPGLITSLIVGVETAKTLSYVWDIPLVAINHIEGHIYANFVSVDSKIQNPNSKQIQNTKSKISDIKFPALILTVSGGHTMLVLMTGHGKYKVIGDTRDDAAGEAFDKAAKLLDIGYPGGPAIAAYAAKSKVKSQKSKVSLPRPMINSKDYDFSFSGLKTALLYQLKKDGKWRERIPEYCSEFQDAVVDVLVSKTIKAAEEFKVETVMLAGGVSANRQLRGQMEEKVKIELPKTQYLMPNIQYTTDNAAMIATAGYFRALRKGFIPWEKIKVDPNLELK
ncbi:MAG: tRNA (adenosine(37)-N6)-threonylcarbamoyltransferase complex transferase subunit TsaD [Patescibacteria group bacterium]